MDISFNFNGIPPRKHGNKSMWDDAIEAPRSIALRKEALKARKNQRNSTFLESLISLKFRLFVPENKLTALNTGDLDNFIRGLCDSLQAAHPHTNVFNKLFAKPKNKDLHPRIVLVFDDDVNIVAIDTKKIPIEDDKENYYRVIVSELHMDGKIQ